MSRFLLAAAFILLVSCSCSELATQTTTTTNEPSVSVAVGTSTATSITASSTTIAPTSTHPAMWPGEFVVWNGTDIVVVDESEQRPVLATDKPIELAYADQLGGVVFQQQLLDGAGPDTPTPPIYRLPAGQTEPQELVSLPPAVWPRLFSTAVVDGAPILIYTVTDLRDFSPEVRSENLHILDLVSGIDRDLGSIGPGWESGANSITIGGELIVVCMGTYFADHLDFYDISGRPVVLRHNPYPPGNTTDADVDLLAAIGPNGTHLAYAETLQVGGDLVGTEAVILDLSNGEELARVHVPDALGLDFDGTTALVSTSAGVISVSTGGESESLLPTAAMATLWRQMPPDHLTSCSAESLSPLTGGQPELPREVAGMRVDIVAAAAACDFEGLERLALVGERAFYFSFDPVDSPAPTWQTQEYLGTKSLWSLVRILSLTPGEILWEGSTVFVWPAAAAYDTWSAVPDLAREDLRVLYSDDDFDVYAETDTYAGYRVWIVEDGDWMAFLAGD